MIGQRIVLLLLAEISSNLKDSINLSKKLNFCEKKSDGLEDKRLTMDQFT